MYNDHLFHFQKQVTSVKIYNFVLDKNSTSNVLVGLTDKWREQLNSGNFACGKFFDIPKISNTMEFSFKSGISMSLTDSLNKCF